MDTIFVVPAILKLFLFTFFISSLLAGIISLRAASKAGGGFFLRLIAFIIGICIHVGYIYVSIRYFNDFGQHVFMIQFISLGIIFAIACAIDNTLNKYY